jgi:Ca2+-binding EF-hand superfamily protein
MSIQSIIKRLLVLEEQTPGFLSLDGVFPFSGDFSKLGRRENILMQLHLVVSQVEAKMGSLDVASEPIDVASEPIDLTSEPIDVVMRRSTRVRGSPVRLGVISGSDLDGYFETSDEIIPDTVVELETPPVERVMTVDEARRGSRLENYSVKEVLTRFKNYSKNNLLSRSNCNKCFRTFHHRGESDWCGIGVIFELFESVPGSGVIDFREFAGGISVLCGGTRKSKVDACFELYSTNQPGENQTISLDDMISYLGSIFKMTHLYQAGDKEVSACELATITSEHVFNEYNEYLTPGGRLSLSDFSKWYM